MRIGLMLGATEGADGTIDGVVATAKRFEAAGFPSLWMANIFGLDAISTLAIVGRETSKIELGTAVVPTYPRHPIAIAQQALTAQAASRGRFALGIGLSHKVVIEDMLGFSYDKPAKHMREYLQVLAPLLRGEPVKFMGEQYRVNAGLQVPGATRVQLLVAALGPAMLKLTGELADGTITWMTGPKTIASHIVPGLREGTQARGKPASRVVAGFPIVVTRNADAAREKIAKQLVIYGQLPSYRAMLDREGLSGPAEIALAGDETELRKGLARLADAGVTDFSAAIANVEEGSVERTVSFLASELGGRK
ncbi:MAG TPA: TIGR03564 family F420-dependent LLM class oxidoreductase [Myxococcota bacterium]|nr:TIGR03564 family F420-dependent LLM class oxidoreductase [Myxococcota bacterium]